jgi:UDP-N-acetylmuramyl pentapeptide phosphotransferase/UDP-N-acetylglucosamine-1-phosphate transferase
MDALLDSAGLIWFIAVWSTAPTIVSLLVLNAVARRFPGRLTRANFLGNRVPVVGGLALLGGFGLTIAIFALFGIRGLDEAPFPQFAGAVAGLGLLGLIDDLHGDRAAGGFRGHIRALAVDRKVTTGLIKLVGGGLVSLWAAGCLAGSSATGSHGLWLRIATVLVDALFIALAANTFNLLDLRPGRCLSVASVAALAVTIAAMVGWPSPSLFIPLLLGCGILGGSLVVLIPDRLGRIMLGDAGSNAIGAGLAVCAICVMPHWAVGFGVVLLAAFQMWCEKHSLTAFIESKPILRGIDRKIGVR